MYEVFVYDVIDDNCVCVMKTDSEEAANFKANLLEALGLITAIGFYEE